MKILAGRGDKFGLRLAAQAAAFLAIGLAGSAAHAGSGTLNFTVLGSPASTGSNWGALTPPTSVTFYDNFTSNPGPGSAPILDDWSFSVGGSASTGTTITGQQIDFSTFTITGVLDAVSIYSGTVGTGTLLKTWAPTALGTYSGVDKYTLTTAGNYYIQVAATQSPNAVGGYSGVFVAAAIPEPGSWALLAAGLSTLGVGTVLRRRC